MPPKKKSKFEITIAVLILFPLLFIAIHGASAYYNTLGKVNGTPTYLQHSQTINAFFNQWGSLITDTPFMFSSNKYTVPVLGFTLFVWFILVAYYFSTRRNLIHGKEFGQSRWGNINDIKDLFAENIKNIEIWKIKFSKFLLVQLYTKYTDIKRMRLMYRDDKKKINTRRHDGAITRHEAKAALVSVIKEEKEQVHDIKCKSYKLTKEQRVQKLIATSNKYDNADMILTSSEHISMYNWIVNNNILIVGGSGAGKSRSFVIPNILQAHSSYVTTDPSGEILAKTGYFLEKKDYAIRVLNLDSKWLSDGYNPFKYLHPERPGLEERVMLLIETIITNTDGGEEAQKNSADPFWPKAERLFLQAIFFFTVYGFCEEERSMNTVMQLIRMLKIKEERDNFDSDLDIFAELLKEQLPDGENNIGYQQFKEFRDKASGKTAKSIVISAVARFAPFKVSEIRRIFSYDNMNLDTVGEKKTAIFVVVPPTDKTYNFIAGMLFSQLFQEIQYSATVAHKHDGNRVPVPVRFVLDELANTCRIPNYIQQLAYARKFGVGIVSIFQSLEQLKSMYKDDWGSVIDNSSSFLFLGSVTKDDSLKYMSDLLGKGTFDKRTSGRTHGRSGSSSLNYDVIGRELMTTSEIRELPKEKCILVVSGRPPFYSDKYRYEQHPNYRYTSDGGGEIYDYKPYIPAVTHGEEKSKSLQLSGKYQKLTEATLSTMVTDKQTLLSHLQKSAQYYQYADTDVDDGEELLVDEQQVTLAALVSEEKSARGKAAAIITEVSPETAAVIDKVMNKPNITFTNDKPFVITGLMQFAKAMVQDTNSIGYADASVDDGETPSISIDDIQEFVNDGIAEDTDESDILEVMKEFSLDIGSVNTSSDDPLIASILSDIAVNS